MTMPTVTVKTALTCAADLASDEGENPSYDGVLLRLLAAAYIGADGTVDVESVVQQARDVIAASRPGSERVRAARQYVHDLIAMSGGWTEREPMLTLLLGEGRD